MYRCPITYELLDHKGYSLNGLKTIHKDLTTLNPLPFNQQTLLQEVALHADKMSVQGVQPKLSAVFSLKNSCFTIVDSGGDYILKAPHIFPELPENEAVTMRLAAMVGIQVPTCGLVYTNDDNFVYFIKRFDRLTKGRRLAVEDFTQLLGEKRQTKYDSSVERVISVIDKYCTFPLIEKREFFIRFLFNFIIGNEDMHLKNYSIIENQGKRTLAPAYDFVNSTIALGGATEESALPLNGKKSNLNRKILFNYLAKERLNLNDSIILKVEGSFKNIIPGWLKTIDVCLLSATMKNKYKNLILKRTKLLGIYSAPESDS